MAAMSSIIENEKAPPASHPPPRVFVVSNVCLTFCVIFRDFSMNCIDFLMSSYDCPMNGHNYSSRSVKNAKQQISSCVSSMFRDSLIRFMICCSMLLTFRISDLFV